MKSAQNTVVIKLPLPDFASSKYIKRNEMVPTGKLILGNLLKSTFLF